MDELPGSQNRHESRVSDPYLLDEDIQARLVDEMFCDRVVLKALMRKLARRMLGRKRQIEPAAVYNGLVVFHRIDLYGGGLRHGQNILRVLLELGLAPCERLFEFCAGPGYIGYSLLANGFCQRLTLSDINPDAVEVAKQTAKYNRIEHLVNVYRSDVLRQIPKDEKWDLVVGNPPGCVPGCEDPANLINCDPGWSVHRRFYASVKEYMRPGGHVLMVEGRAGSSPDLFEPMIRAGGARIVATNWGTDFRGQDIDKYYMISQW